MDRDDMNQMGAFLSGFIIGGLVAAAVSLLFAPQSGEETRLLLRERGQELEGRAEALAEQARERSKHLQEVANEQIVTTRGKASSTLTSLRERVRRGAEGTEADADLLGG